MLAPTHLLAGQTAYLGACLATGLAPDLAEGLVAAAAGLIPDLDKRSGIVGRLFPFLSEPLEYYFGHRTLTHSLLFLVTLGGLLWPLLPAGWWWAVMAGVASHQVADWATPRGVAWFWPAKARAVLPGNVDFRAAPMSWGEFGVAAALAVAAFPLLALAQMGHGSGGVITATIADIRAARETYDAERGRNMWQLEIEGTANRTAAEVAGTYQVRGPWKAGGFIVDTPQGPRSACAGSNCDWYAERAVLHKGETRITTSRRIRTDQLSRKAMMKALAPLQETGRVLLVGSLQAKGVESAKPALEAKEGGQVTIRYAAPKELEGLPKSLREVDLVVQVRHKPGAEVPEVKLTRRKPAVSPLLQKWLE